MGPTQTQDSEYNPKLSWMIILNGSEFKLLFCIMKGIYLCLSIYPNPNKSRHSFPVNWHRQVSLQPDLETKGILIKYTIEKMKVIRTSFSPYGFWYFFYIWWIWQWANQLKVKLGHSKHAKSVEALVTGFSALWEAKEAKVLNLKVNKLA